MPASFLVSALRHQSSLSLSRRPFPPIMPRRGRAIHQWKEKPRDPEASIKEKPRDPEASIVADRLAEISIDDPPSRYAPPAPARRVQQHQSQQRWLPKSLSSSSAPTAAYATTSSTAKQEEVVIRAPKKTFSGPLGADFNVDSNTFCRAAVRATFYPKFENEKSDQEIRIRMIEMASHGQATVEVSLKHSGSLFMYAGHEGGSYAKNSFGNIYTAVGVFVLGRMFREAWGTEAGKMQAKFNNYLEENRLCLSMELVTAVLGDHGQRPIDDYVVVTAVTELGNGKPNFYSTPELIAFCRKWRLPTNHVWLFSTRKSVASFFAAYDALCEEGTATPVCKALDQIADVSIPGSKDHIIVQGEILEGLVARIVSHGSSEHMRKVLQEFPPPPQDGVGHNLGPDLREICASNRSNEKEQIKALLEHCGKSMCPDWSDWFGDDKSVANLKNADRSVLTKFLQAPPIDFSTIKLQEMIRLMKQRHFPAAFKCYCNYHKWDSVSSENIDFKMVIHVYSDSVFKRYQKEMRRNSGLWPLYRGFFVDVNLFKANKERTAELAKGSDHLFKKNGNSFEPDSPAVDGLADEDANLMIKLKFLTYKLRTFLIRNGLSILFKDGPSSYKAYYLRQMKIWGTSVTKQKALSKMLDEWAVYIRRKCGNKQLSSSTYLSEAEVFLEQYANRSLENQTLIGSAGNLVKAENFMAIVEGGMDEEGDLSPESDPSPPTTPLAVDTVSKQEGLIIFFPGIPGCAKSALCKEILNAPGGLGDNRPFHSLMGDLIKGRYWQKVTDERRKKPFVITLADKNAPNEEVWRQIEDMCRTTKASAVPVVPDSEGTDSNPFSLEALAIFLFRVLQRVNHPGNLDKSSPNAGYVLLMFYHLYDGKSRREFESDLSERFGALVKMPLLRSDRDPLPYPVKEIMEEGINLYRLHTNKHGRLESSKGTYAKEWSGWEKRIRDVLFAYSDHLNSIQVPFEYAVKCVMEQLKDVAKGEYLTPDTEKRKFGNIVFAAISLPVVEIYGLLDKLAQKDHKVKDFLEDKDLENNLKKAHLTLAHKRSHGVTSVASYGVFLQQEVPVEFTALLFSDKLAALEARPGSVDGEKISSKNPWPHITLWTAMGIPPKEANTLPQLLSEGKATRIEIDPIRTVSGVLNFY